MGCNCGKTKLEGYSKDKFGNKISHAVRNLWEKSKQEQKPVNVTKINKK
jgi:ribosomal protein L18E